MADLPRGLTMSEVPDPYALDLARFAVPALTEVLLAMAEIEPDEAWRQGGFLTLVPRKSIVIPAITIQVGPVPFERYVKYRDYSVSKPMSLANNPELVSTWSLRDLVGDARVPGGGVRGIHYWFGFSGLSEWGDEALNLRMMTRTNEIAPDDYDQVLTLSRNRVYHRVVARSA